MMRVSSLLGVVVVVVLALCSMAHAADPVVDSVSWVARGNEHVTLVDVTFSFSDADGYDCWLALFGHDEITRGRHLIIDLSEEQ